MAIAVAGAVLLVVAALGLAFSWGSPDARPSKPAVAAKTSTPPAVAGSPTPDAVATWQALLTPFADALAMGNNGYLFDHLDPVVFGVYSVVACQTAVYSSSADPTVRYEVLSVDGPAPWPYEAEGQSITVPDAYTVVANVTSQGKVTQETHHFTVREGNADWFTKCTTATASP